MMAGSPKPNRGHMASPKKFFYSLWYGGTARRNCLALLGCIAIIFIIFYRNAHLKHPPRGAVQPPSKEPEVEKEKLQEVPSPPLKPAEVEEQAAPPDIQKERKEEEKDERKPVEEKEEKKAEQKEEEPFGEGWTLSVKGDEFKIAGRSILILSGAIHYFRVPWQYWRDRLKKLKACGLNTVETYVPWNLHEEYPESYSFADNLDLLKFMDIAKQEKLYVILRPGPYICSEWDLGGLPSWLLRDPKMDVRTMYTGYTQAVERYFNVLIPKILPYQLSNGGPIIMVQVENEYGQYAEDAEHMIWLRDLMKKLGVKEKFFTSDPKGALKAGRAGHELMMVNGQVSMADALDHLKQLQPNKPLMVGEFWTGWFDHWGENHHTVQVAQYSDTLKSILEKKASVNLYMFHGGTNFGFLNGANFPSNIYPTITSYDYAAPLSENGEMTEKFHATCKAIATYAKTGYEYNAESFEALKNTSPASKAYGTFQVTEFLTLTDVLEDMKPYVVNRLVPMEQICDALTTTSTTCKGQNFGFIAYRTKSSGNTKLSIEINVRDRAQIIINGKVSALTGPYNLAPTETTDLIILVENQGRVNYGTSLNNQRKGLLDGNVFLDGKPVNEWQIYSLDLKSEFVLQMAASGHWKKIGEKSTSEQQPGFYKIPLGNVIPGNLKEGEFPPDTFLDFKGWEHGAALLNGFNLGRYWNKGPQKTLYMPGPRLLMPKEQKSPSPELIMFETGHHHTEVVLQETADLG